jgi:hypothetical protein
MKYVILNDSSEINYMCHFKVVHIILLNRWANYEESHEQFSDWLKEEDLKLKRDIEPQASLLEMEQQFAQYQVWLNKH